MNGLRSQATTRVGRVLHAAVFGAAAGLAGCDRAATPPQPADASKASDLQPTTTPADPAASVAPAAITYFQDHCASCHGPYARFAGPQYGRSLSDEALLRKIEEMAAGPGRSPLDAAGLAAQAAYHRSLVQGTPFVSLTAKTDDEARGEVTPGATVEVLAGGQSHAASVDGHRWSVRGVGTIEKIVATASGGARRTELDVTRAVFSHAE